MWEGGGEARSGRPQPRPPRFRFSLIPPPSRALVSLALAAVRVNSRLAPPAGMASGAAAGDAATDAAPRGGGAISVASTAPVGTGWGNLDVGEAEMGGLGGGWGWAWAWAARHAPARSFSAAVCGGRRRTPPPLPWGRPHGSARSFRGRRAPPPLSQRPDGRWAKPSPPACPPGAGRADAGPSTRPHGRRG